MPTGGCERSLVEGFVAEHPMVELNAGGFERADVSGKVGTDEGERRTRQRRVVQADRDTTVGKDRIAVRPGLAGDRSGETELQIELP